MRRAHAIIGFALVGTLFACGSAKPSRSPEPVAAPVSPPSPPAPSAPAAATTTTEDASAAVEEPKSAPDPLRHYKPDPTYDRKRQELVDKGKKLASGRAMGMAEIVYASSAVTELLEFASDRPASRLRDDTTYELAGRTKGVVIFGGTTWAPGTYPCGAGHAYRFRYDPPTGDHQDFVGSHNTDATCEMRVEKVDGTSDVLVMFDGKMTDFDRHAAYVTRSVFYLRAPPKAR